MKDAINNLRSFDATKAVVAELRKSIRTVYCGLKDTFCDTEEPKGSWTSTKIPNQGITFFFELFSIKKKIFFHAKKKKKHSSVNNNYGEDEKSDQTLQTLTASFHHSGLSISYTAMQRHRQDLARFAVMRNQYPGSSVKLFRPHLFHRCSVWQFRPSR